MLKNSSELIASELTEGTGAAIALKPSPKGLRTGLDIWFTDLQRNHGPVIELRPHGLKSHRVLLYLGNFAGGILTQIANAPPDDVLLARSLVSSIRPDANVTIPGQSPDSWTIKDGKFTIIATLRHEMAADNEVAIVSTCRDIIVPLMAAMAELIGYDEVAPEVCEGETEGAVRRIDVLRRERNPRNRLLCLRIHGARCKCCSKDPLDLYGEAGKIIEVHHLQPLAQLGTPRPYDPRTDLVPLCPDCHRAVHTRRPTPLSLIELQTLMGRQ
jgi:5-methylcytosine-specific restriction protein A